MNEINNISSVVESLNEKLFEKASGVETEECFSLLTNGYCYIITFGKHELWNSENDEREWIEKNDDYEPLEPHIISIYNKWIDNLQTLKL